MHDVALLSTLTIGLTAALVLGYLTQRVGLSPILGYLLAGVAVGPYTPGPVADAGVAAQFAEVGVILLMFGVGLHFRLKDLLQVKAIAIPGAVGQSVGATALGGLVAHLFGWTLINGIVLGIAISVASTVVLIRVLTDNKVVETPQGHVAVGWLIVEDVFTVLVLVLLPVLATSAAGGGSGALAVATSVGLALLKLAAMTGVVLAGGSKAIPWILNRVARTRSRELFTLTVLAIALAVATGSAHVFGASMALGAFLAGMVVGQSKESHQAAADALPMRDAFAVLFFVSVGMLFDPRLLVSQPALVLSILAIVLVAKPVLALGIVLGLGYSVKTALTVAIGLAQIGEFSFILADEAAKLKLLPPEAQSVLVASALISISLNPLLFRAAGRIEEALRARPRLWRILSARAESRGKGSNETMIRTLAEEKEQTRAVVVGYGPVGQTVTRILSGFGIRPVIVDLNVHTITRLREEGAAAIYGDAGKADVLRAAGIERAKYLVVTLPDLPARVPVIIEARSLRPDLILLVRGRYLAERPTLEEFGVTAAVYEEAEAAVGLSELLLRAEGTDDEKIRAERERIRSEFAPRPETL